MATLSVLTFDLEDRPIEFDTWLDDLQLYLLRDSKDGFSLLDLTSSASLAPAATADSVARSQWLTRDAAARLAVRNHLPLAERAHFGQHKTAKALYDAVVARYSSPANVALGHLLLPYLFPELSAFATVAGLWKPSPLVPSVASTRAVDYFRAEEVGAASAPSGRRRGGRGRGGRGGAGGRGGGSGGSSGGGGGGGGGGGRGGGGGGVGGSGGGGGGFGGGGGGGGSGSGGGDGGGGRGGTSQRGGLGAGQRQQQQRLSPQELHEWFAQRGAAGGSGRCPYVIRTIDRTCQTCEKLHTQHRCSSRLDDAFRIEFPDATELPRWAELLRQGVDIFALNYDAILAAMYALTFSAEGDCYLCMSLGPGIEAVSLGASESAASGDGESALSGTAFAAALHTFTLDSVLPRSSTVLPCPAVPSGLLRSLTPLPPSPAPPRLSCVKGWQCAAPHSSSFPLTIAPLQTLHMDVWGPARVHGQGCDRYFLLVVDDYSRYTTVFPLCSKGEVPDVLIPWIRAVRLQLRERFDSDLPVLRLHSDRGGEFSSNLLRDFCRGEGIRQKFTLPASPQQNGVAERRIGLFMERPRRLRWTGEVGDASVFRVWRSRAFVRETSADKLSSRAIPCVFLGFPPDAPGSQFYHPTLRRVLPSQDVTFDESVPFYSVSQVDPVEPVEVAVDSGAARGAAPKGAEPGVAASEGVEPGGAEPEHAEPGGAKPGVAEPECAEPGGAEPRGAEPERDEPGGTLFTRGPPGVSSRREPLSSAAARMVFSALEPP
ncbi:unnamed protein product [Closterium sp. NIES-65]|nr:unnamed protein product [Closterium sp. NIES-65]